MLILFALRLVFATRDQLTCSDAITHWLTRSNNTVGAAHEACAADASCSAHVLGPRKANEQMHVQALLRGASYGDVPAAVCGELGDDDVGARLVSLWLVTQMLARRDLCPRGFEHVLKQDRFECECLLGNQCDDYFKSSGCTDWSNTERVLFCITTISSVLLLLLGFVRFVVVYNRTVPHDHHHDAPNNK